MEKIRKVKHVRGRLKRTPLKYTKGTTSFRVRNHLVDFVQEGIDKFLAAHPKNNTNFLVEAALLEYFDKHYQMVPPEKPQKEWIVDETE